MFAVMCSCGWASGLLPTRPMRIVCLACEEREMGAERHAKVMALANERGGLLIEQPVEV